MNLHRMQTFVCCLTLGIGACASDADDSGAQSNDDAPAEVFVVESKLVSTVSSQLVSSVVRRINMSDLAADFPAEVAGRVDLASLRAADVAGWYDKGNAFHEQKMEKNVGHQLGEGEQINQAAFRGTSF